MTGLNAGLPPEDWDTQLKKMGGHFLQSRIWAEFQHRLGRPVYWMADKQWLWWAAWRQGRGIRYLYSSYGPTWSRDTAASSVLDSLRQVGTQLAADFVRLEPLGPATEKQLEALGARSFPAIQPQRTLVVDLEQDETALRAALSSGHRNAVNGAERRGLKFSSSADPAAIETFLTMLLATAHTTGFRPYPKSYYRILAQVSMPAGAARLFWAELEGEKIAGALAFDFGGVRHYAHAASFAKARESQAAVPLVWQMMLDAKAAGFKSFDLWGIASSDDPHHPWAGFTKFKRAFGGEVVERLGTWDLPLKKAKYVFYRAAKKALA